MQAHAQPHLDFPSCCTTMADSCVRNSEFVLCSTYVLYINRHKIPFHRISEYSCHAPLADNGTLFPLASRSEMFRYRESFSESIANTRNGYGCKQEHSSASRRPFKIQIEFHHKCIIKYDYEDDKHKRIPEAVFQPACRREEGMIIFH